MNEYYYALFLVFSILAVMIVLDENVAIYVTLIFKIIRINLERIWWMIRFHPKNPITNLMMKWKYDRLARELEREFQSKMEHSDD